jgi:RNA polymerase sigma-70 factor, ECF subfamily
MIGDESRRQEDPSITDAVRRAKSGDAAAFEWLLRLHERRVFLTALHLLGSVEDAKDASQEVFLRLHKHLRRFDDGRSLGPWLYRVAVNVCRDMAAKNSRHEELAGETPAPEAARDWGDERRIVALGLKRLPEKERAAVVLRDIEGLSTAEVARALGSSEATVRSQVSSARIKLKQFADRMLGRVK